VCGFDATKAGAVGEHDDAGSRAAGGEGDVIAEGFEAGDQASGGAFGVAALVVVAAEVVTRRARGCARVAV
jgi:hypothetical protein